MKIKTLDITHSNINSKKAKIPIYSISVHPHLSKLATGGQDFKIRIWNTNQILNHSIYPNPGTTLLDQSIKEPQEGNEEGQTNSPQDRLLSTLSMHDGAVLTVRWSIEGEYLASGADDQKIVIWKFDESGRGGFGEANKESYRAVKVLIGHESDVADLAWSPNQQYLASCGFDYRIFIWDATSFDRITRIDSHVGFVKGITWDPAGQFLAAQSDDRTVKVYRTSDWKVEKEITAPYQNGNTTTFFRRLSWSPDGTSIATVNGENSGICVAPVIYRTDWQSSVCLVGHDAPVEVASFNPHLFTLIDPKTNEKSQTTVLALGSQDNGLSIWWTGSARAVCSIRDLFTHSILDLCWTFDGLGLYACSYDGSIAYLQFEPSDFGSRVSTSEKESKLQKYGSIRKDIIPESSTILQMEKILLEKEKLEGRMDDGHFDVQDGFEAPVRKVSVPILKPPMQQAIPSGLATASQQNVTTNKDGKKRIRPVLVQQAAPLLDSPGKSSQRTAQPLSSSENKRPRTLSSIIGAGTGSEVGGNTSTVMNSTYTLPVIQSLKSSQNILSIPSVRPFFTVQCVRKNQLDLIELKNNANGCQILSTKSGNYEWSSSYKSAALIATMSTKFTAIAYTDATVHIYSVAGRRFLPLKMQSAAAFLSSSEEFLLYVDCIGNVSLWNIPTMKSVYNHIISMTPLLDQSITNVLLRNNDQIVVQASNGSKEFIYSSDMNTWLLLSPPPLGHFSKLPKVDELELHLNTAIQTMNSKNIVYWLKLYARKLTDDDSFAKAEELCSELNTTGTLGGMIKKELLKLILPILIKNRGFQRFLVHLSDLVHFDHAH